MIVLSGLENTFIETFDGESAEDWRRAVEHMLTDLMGRADWWHPFSVGPVVHWEGQQFRSFRSVAGSVSGHLWMEAAKHRLPRGFMLIGPQHPDGQLIALAWCGGIEFTFDATQLAAQLPMPSPNATGGESKERA